MSNRSGSWGSIQPPKRDERELAPHQFWDEMFSFHENQPGLIQFLVRVMTKCEEHGAVTITESGKRAIAYAQVLNELTEDENNYEDAEDEVNESKVEEPQIKEPNTESRVEEKHLPIQIILVGLPGSGKTTLGKALAACIPGGVYLDQDMYEGRGKKYLNAIAACVQKAAPLLVLGASHHIRHERASVLSTLDTVKQVFCLRQEYNRVFVVLKHPKDKISPKGKFVQLQMERLCADRIQKRGKNHPSLKAGPHVNTVLSQFVAEFQYPSSDEGAKVVEWDASVQRTPAQMKEAAQMLLESIQAAHVAKSD